MKTKKLKPCQVKRIIKLYENGITEISIARRFERHHSTIIYHLRKAGAKQLPVCKPKVEKKIDKYEYLTNEKTIKVLSYKEQLRKQQDRILIRQHNCSHNKVVTVITKCNDCGHVISEERKVS